MVSERAGLVVLLGSGETSASGRRAFDWLMSRIDRPIHVAILETPAGFQPNSDLVAGKVADFLRERLQNYRPEVTVIPARRRGTDLSPDDPAVVAPLLRANVLFMGPGSPTYTVRQLQGSLAWQTLLLRHRQGAAVVLASAATIAAGTWALPVYEIYKAGEDLHWQPGLDLFAACGLALVFVPHWDNKEGGAELDTSRCFMGQERFARLRALLNPAVTVVGIDEHTALVLDLAAQEFQVIGRGGVTVQRGGTARRFAPGVSFPFQELGECHYAEAPPALPPGVQERMQAALAELERETTVPSEPPPEVLHLLESRQSARAARDWAAADLLREQVAAQGWKILDTPEGPQLEPLAE